jgi:hypothetical protein
MHVTLREETMSTQQSSALPSADSLLDRIPNWVGFGLIILVGILAIIFGGLERSPGLIAFGVAAIASSILAWANGARSRPDVGWKKFGGTVKNIDGWVWVVVFLLFAAAVAIAVFVH